MEIRINGEFLIDERKLERQNMSHHQFDLTAFRDTHARRRFHMKKNRQVTTNHWKCRAIYYLYSNKETNYRVALAKNVFRS